MRMPFDFDTESRDGSSNKDERLTNALVEQDDSAKYAVIRPGLNLNLSTTGIGKGVVAFQNELICVYGNSAFEIVDSVEAYISGLLKPAGSTYWADVCWNGEKFLAVNQQELGRVAISTDGITWTSVLTGGSDAWAVCAWSGTYFVLLEGYSSTHSAYSADGESWTVSSGPSTDCISLVSNGSVVVGVAPSSNESVYSTDGQTWTTVTSGHPTGSRLGVAWNGTRFVFLSTSGSTVTPRYSSDGITWSTGTTFSSTQSMLIASNGVGFVAITRGGSRHSYTSTDGNVWTLHSSALPSAAYYMELIWDGVEYVAFDFDTTIFATSTDGITWVADALPSANEWGAACKVGTGEWMLISNNDLVTVYKSLGPALVAIDTVTGEYFDFAEST